MTVTDQSVVFHTANKALPIVVGGSGVYITVKDPQTGDIKTLIDGSSGAAVSSVGHCDPEIQTLMKKAVDDLVYTFPTIVTNEPAQKLAQFIIDNSPEGAFASTIFTGSGSESNENMLKIAYKYHMLKGEAQRTKFVSRKQSYHGYTLGALSLSDNVRRAEFDAILFPNERFPKVSPIYPYRNLNKGETLIEYKDRLLAELENLFIAEGPETIACFVCEPVGGSTFGCQPALPGYLDGARDICHKYGILFILDEVMCGIGRTGTFHAWEQLITDGPGPDIQTVGKTLGAGYVTIAGILISPKVMKVYRDQNATIAGGQTYHLHSFNCQVALDVQEKVKRDGLIENIYKVGNYFGKTLKERLQNYKYVGDVRGTGGFWAVEFVQNKDTKEPFPREVNFFSKFSGKLFENGALCLGGAGTIEVLGDHALFSPAFSITKEEADKLIELIAKTLAELEAEV